MSLGLPKAAASQVIADVGKWTTCSGSEWTVARLKEVKLIYLHKLAGTPYKPTSWIAVDSDGLPKGPMKVLFRHTSKRNLSKTLTMLNSYSAFVSSQFTEKQKEKFFSSLESDDETGMDSKLVPVLTGSQHPNTSPPTIIEYCTGSQRGPSFTGKTTKETDVIQMFLHGAMSNPVRSIVAEYEDIFGKVIPIDVFFNIEPHEGYGDDVNHTLGTISGIQEPGYKLRAVANPSRVLQAGLEPLKRELRSMLRRFPTDHTEDQMGAIPKIQSWLDQGRKVYSVDLSDATNLFPWPLQRDLLIDCCHDSMAPFIGIMDACATGPWKTSIRGYPEVVRFTRGQPLGLGPSFFSFAFAHNTLLQGICDKRGIEPRFCVLGDDVVIADSQLHKVYRKTLANLGCKISEAKTFKSSTMAEFAGCTILKDRFGKSFKWREISDHSFLDAARNLGKGSLSMFTSKQRRLMSILGPIPTSLGGAGWSDGRNLTDFLSSKLGEMSLQAFVAREGKEKTIIWRDLVYDCRRFLRTAMGYQTSNLTSLMKGDSWRQLKIYDFWDIKEPVRFDTWVYPHELVAQGLWSDKLREYGYYPIVQRVGDPRGTPLSLAEGILSQNSELLSAVKRRKSLDISDYLIPREDVDYSRPQSEVVSSNTEIQSLPECDTGSPFEEDEMEP